MKNKIKNRLESILPPAFGLGSLLAFEVELLHLAERAGMYDNIDFIYGNVGMNYQDSIEIGTFSVLGGGSALLAGALVGKYVVKGIDYLTNTRKKD